MKEKGAEKTDETGESDARIDSSGVMRLCYRSMLILKHKKSAL
jgi:DNA-directed RNA polymerase subunit N (RpoN/RPB10)